MISTMAHETMEHKQKSDGGDGADVTANPCVRKMN